MFDKGGWEFIGAALFCCVPDRAGDFAVAELAVLSDAGIGTGIGVMFEESGRSCPVFETLIFSVAGVSALTGAMTEFAGVGAVFAVAFGEDVV